MSDVTRLLDAAQAGDRQAAVELLPLVYTELRKLAATRMNSEVPGHTLDATALVHEAYLRLIGNQQFDGRGHFFAAAAEAMRRILVNHARDKKRLKREGGRKRLELLDQAGSMIEDPDLILSIDELLARLALEDEVASKIAHLHIFVGFRSKRRASCCPSRGQRLTGIGSTPGPGCGKPSKNNPESARRFSPDGALKRERDQGDYRWRSILPVRNPYSWPHRILPMHRNEPPS